MRGAIAIDLGATSARFAAGTLRDGVIRFEVIEQTPHAPIQNAGRLEWDLGALLSICRRAVDYARVNFESSTIGIDSWGVDIGFVSDAGEVLEPPVCYRDLSHERAFAELAPYRERLYALTGIQHQPFNTICQLRARANENPAQVGKLWMNLPDLLGFLLAGRTHHELTEASTTQLLGLDKLWCDEAFDIVGWPTPQLQPSAPGRILGEIAPGVSLATVGSHDTASAVAGFGPLSLSTMFANVGTWSLVGCLMPTALPTREAEQAAFTNERAIDGSVRFLKNIPGFYVINRLHEELNVAEPVPKWLEGMAEVDERIDLLNPGLFNPASMLDACRQLAGRAPKSNAEWAGLALSSLTRTIAQQPAIIGALTGREIKSIRVGGGGSQSPTFCQSLANESGLTVVSGPSEVTVLGNLGEQLLASGMIHDRRELEAVLEKSAGSVTFTPNR